MNKEFSVTPDFYLWEEFRSGDDLAFGTIYRTYADVLFRYGMKFTPDEELVKDCIQELFIEIYSHKQNLGRTNNIKLYLLKSLKRRIIKAIRFQSDYSSINETDAPFFITYTQNDGVFTDEQADKQTKEIQKALNELSPRQKEAIYLRFNTGLSYEEICEAMNLNYQSVRNLVFRAIDKMRINLSQTNMILFFVLKQC